MSDVEKLHFKIGLAGSYWDKKPIYSISINDSIRETRQIESESGEIFYIEFDQEVEEGPVSLKIRLENKTDSDVVKDNPTQEDFTIIKDLMLHIKNIEIDGIELGQLIWEKSIFTGDDPARPVLDNCVDLGWNGAWELKFDSPFYIWLLENI
jgi:hypothetical protein